MTRSAPTAVLGALGPPGSSQWNAQQPSSGPPSSDQPSTGARQSAQGSSHQSEATRHLLDQMLRSARSQHPELRQQLDIGSCSLWATPGCVQLRHDGATGGEAAIQAAWTQGGAPYQLGPSWQQTARDQDASGLTVTAEGESILHASVSGAQPLYVCRHGETVFFSTRLRWLVEAMPSPLTPDSAAWSQILAFGAPLAGRTTFQGFRRLQPMEYMYCAPGQPARRGQDRWPWEEVDPDSSLRLDDVTDQTVTRLAEHILPHLQSQGASLPVNPMLSGGRDSRLLTALAGRYSPERAAITTWTTSSDTGTAMEELVAARVAEDLGVRQRLLAPHYEQFSRDFADYADTVDYQASYHVWLMPVARELGQHPGTILDGLGGGVFLGGGFPDPPEAAGASESELLDIRFARMARYVADADRVFEPATAQRVQEAGYEDFRDVAAKYTDHPNGHTLSAYLTRTLPGISLAPARVLSSAQPTLMPILAHDVVTGALSLDPALKRDGAWYPALLAHADERLSGQPTAADLTSRRHHLRRAASTEAIAFFRQQLMESSTAELLNPHLRHAHEVTWARMLSNTKQQHLIRGMTMLSLWLDDYADVMTASSAQEVLHG